MFGAIGIGLLFAWLLASYLSSSPKVKKYFHICSNSDCVSPVTGRKIFYEDDHGKPVVVKCPDCGIILVRIMKNGAFWLCSKCNKTFNDKAGKPELSLKKK